MPVESTPTNDIAKSIVKQHIEGKDVAALHAKDEAIDPDSLPAPEPKIKSIRRTHADIVGKTTIIGSQLDLKAAKKTEKAAAVQQILDAANPSKQTEAKPNAEPGREITVDPATVGKDNSETPSGDKEDGKQGTPVEQNPGEKDKWAAKFTHLTRRENAITKREREVKERERHFEHNIGRLGRFDEVVAKAKVDPLAFLEFAGISYDDVTKAFLATGKPDAEKKVEAIEAKVDKIAAETQEKATKAAEERLNNAIAGVKKDLKDAIENDATKFELCSVYGDAAINLAYEVMQEYFVNTKKATGNGKFLSHEEALQTVEDFYEQQAERLATTKKISSKAQTKTAGVNGADVKQVANGHQANPPKTITNSTVTDTPVPDDPAGMTKEQRFNKAISMLKWT